MRLYDLLDDGESQAAAAGITLFLRVFPLLLRLGTRIAMRRQGASAALAFAQMERTRRPAARMILLLALGTAFSAWLNASGRLEIQILDDHIELWPIPSNLDGHESAAIETRTTKGDREGPHHTSTQPPPVQR